MKTSVPMKCLPILVIFLACSTSIFAQCPAGATRDTLNWDYLDFLPNSGTYIAPTAFINLAQSQTQRFTFANQVVTFKHNYSGANIGGDVSIHSGQTSTYGKGDDLQFKGNGAITFTFDTAVQNLKFSIADIDKSQIVAVTAKNGASAINVNATTLSGSILTISGNGTISATATATSAEIANNANTPAANGTLNVDITGPVTSVTLTITNTGTSGGGEDGSFFISDISACYGGTFPTNYYHIAKPFAGQPAYVLAVLDNTIYYVNPANGAARKLFKDGGHTNINSLAYDPYRRMVYYSYSLSGSPSTDKAIRRYDYEMDTLGVMLPNVNTIGIPTYNDGVESGAAAFYNNSLYLGIEGGDNGKTNRESSIWKIDFNSSFAPVKSAQVYALPVDDGSGNGIHDWGDVGINNGMLYDFDGSSGGTDFYHFNMQTGQGSNVKPSPSTVVPRQVSVDWDGKMYNSGSPSSSSSGNITPYNYDGTVNGAQSYTMKVAGVAVTGSWGDAGEAFKPKTDFGDAPSSYDPAISDPGTHEKNDSIRLGNAMGIEWAKKTSADASGDGAEEDGVNGLQIITTGVSNFVVSVKVYNNTNRNATLCGWVDANGNGTFEASEGATLVVTPSASVQTKNLLWSGINTTLPAYSNTFMRLRVTTADQGMNTTKPTGYFDNGEIEDYPVSVSLLLPDQNVLLKAQKSAAKSVSITWELNYEEGNKGYELQRSADGTNWQTINTRNSSGSKHSITYSYQDDSPDQPASYYRIKVNKVEGADKFSEIRKVEFKQESSMNIWPNPAKNMSVLTLQAVSSGMARLNIFDNNGRRVFNEPIQVVKGENEYYLPLVQKLGNGIYKVRVHINDEVLNGSLVIAK
ncbi:MAG TPA: GEVED domain-containing protein [Ferruginibacter sp.]|nr:GEVED domain-containing protein [Ferruginibacter sp.]